MNSFVTNLVSLYSDADKNTLSDNQSRGFYPTGAGLLSITGGFVLDSVKQVNK